MKTQTTRFRAFLQLAFVVSVTGLCSLAQAAIVVNMEVNQAQDELVITTHGTCSGNNPARGCMKVTGKQQINFNLIGNKKCTNAPPGSKWMLESVVLSESKNSAPGISDVAASDFGADKATGVVTSPVSQNWKHIGIRDDNTAAYEVWYTVNAKCAGGTGKLSTDPRIQNDGTGSRN